MLYIYFLFIWLFCTSPSQVSYWRIQWDIKQESAFCHSACRVGKDNLLLNVAFVYNFLIVANLQLFCKQTKQTSCFCSLQRESSGKLHEYDAQGWNIHAVCYAFIPLQWPTVKQRINRERENLWFRLEAVYHQTGVTFSDVTPWYFL